MASIMGDEQMAVASTNMAQVSAVAEALGKNGDLLETIPKAMEQTVTKVMAIKDIYRPVMVDNNNRNGNYFVGDPLLDDDFGETYS